MRKRIDKFCQESELGRNEEDEKTSLGKEKNDSIALEIGEK